MAHHVIFVPGLGDKRRYGQDIAIQVWWLFGLRPHYFALRWDKQTGFEAKMQRLQFFITALQKEGHTVSLVGASAGASAVIHAYVANKDVRSVVYLCGKINHPETVRSHLYQKNPDFKQSLELLQENLCNLTLADKQNILSLYPYKDQLVPYRDTKIRGVREQRLLGWSHAQGIISGIIIGAPLIAGVVRKAASRQNGRDR